MNLITIVLLIMTIASLFFKVDHSCCYCGIFAFSGKKNITVEQIQLAMMKFKLLGLYNQSRGVHGCGTYTDNKILKGADKEKLFEKFIEVNDLPLPDPDGNRIMIGHCRQASRGAQTLANTHPFLINEDLVGVHNGTVTNTFEISKRQGFTFRDYDVDSQLLFMTIEKGDLAMLNMYEGAAALVWSRLSEPNKMYVYHGKSRDVKGGVIYEERPLYFLEEEEGLYFSSMENSLYAIQEGDKRICCLKYNEVIAVEDGIFLKGGIVVDREDTNIKNNYNYYGHTNFEDEYPNNNRSVMSIPAATTPLKGTGTYVDYEGKIFKETLPMRAVNDINCIYFHKGRFHMPDGNLCEGPVHLQKKGTISNSSSDKSKTVWFVKGIMAKNLDDYNILKNCKSSPMGWFTDPTKNLAMFASRYSVYPVTNYEDEAKSVSPFYKYAWYIDGQRASSKDNFTPKYGGRHYSFANGFLSAISNSNKKGSVDNSLFYTDNPTRTSTDLIAVKPSTEDNNTEDAEFEEIEYELFDKVYESLEEACNDLTDGHIKAIKNYINDYVCSDNSLDPDNEEIGRIFMRVITESCKRNISIREQLSDTNENLDLYYDLAMETIGEAGKQNTIDFSKISSIQDALEKDIAEAIDIHEQLKEAENLALDAIDDIESIFNQAGELVCNEHDLSQEFAAKIYLHMDNLRHDLAEIAATHKSDNLVRKLNNLNSNVI